MAGAGGPYRLLCCRHTLRPSLKQPAGLCPGPIRAAGCLMALRRRVDVTEAPLGPQGLTPRARLARHAKHGCGAWAILSLGLRPGACWTWAWGDMSTRQGCQQRNMHAGLRDGSAGVNGRTGGAANRRHGRRSTHLCELCQRYAVSALRWRVLPCVPATTLLQHKATSGRCSPSRCARHRRRHCCGRRGGVGRR